MKKNDKLILPNTLEYDTRSTTMTPEFIQKSDKDIETITTLNSYAKSNGYTVILYGGYATEAYCGGKIVRPHGDIDCYLVCPTEDVKGEVFNQVENILKKEDTQWTITRPRPDKLELREDNEKKSFFDRRRIELTIHSDKDDCKYQSKYLVDSKNNSVSVNVIDISTFVAGKIHKFYLLKDGVDTTKDRTSGRSDYEDLNRLLNSSDFDENKMISELSKTVGIEDVTEEISYVRELLKKLELQTS